MFPVKEELQIEVKPGYSEETVLEFPSKGNQAHAMKPSKLLVKFKQMPHDNYRRKGNDLIYTQKINLQ